MHVHNGVEINIEIGEKIVSKNLQECFIENKCVEATQ